ncbi:hypothetical protein [Roseateles sp.]|uniref:hypothetical protein n=1 Tax=Roseateles sp. TaxID=1971397 RepID=UPI002F405F8E
MSSEEPEVLFGPAFRQDVIAIVHDTCIFALVLAVMAALHFLISISGLPQPVQRFFELVDLLGKGALSVVLSVSLVLRFIRRMWGVRHA